MMADLIFLVGYMGSGKSTIGHKLAKKLAYEFVDLDSLIEVRCDRSIPVLFHEKGEDQFRKLEQEALHSLSGRKKLVVATGGGCAAYANNMEWMNNEGLTIYLRCHPGTLFHRVAPNKAKRPLIAHLDDVDIMEFIMESLKKRLPYYVKAKITVSGEQKNEEIVSQLGLLISGKSTSSSGDPQPLSGTF